MIRRLTITLENGNDVIVYALEKVISYSKRMKQILVAHCVWWLASVIGLEQGFIIYIDYLQKRFEISHDKAALVSETRIPQKVTATSNIHPERLRHSDRSEPFTSEFEKQDIILQKRENVLLKSKAIRRSILKGPPRQSRKVLAAASDSTTSRDRKVKRAKRAHYPESDGIDSMEFETTPAAGECPCCAQPQDRKRNHKVKNCRRPICLEKGTPF